MLLGVCNSTISGREVRNGSGVQLNKVRVTRTRMTATTRRGALIVLEGVDRAGKSTQCAKMVDFLQSIGRPAELWRFPDRTTTIGEMINSYLSNATDIDDGCIHLLFSANRWEKKDQMMKKLQQGVTLVVDRYAFSGVAFTAAKGISGLHREWCMAPDTGLIAPDVVYFLELSPEAAAARGGFGEDRYERPAFQQAVVKEFQHMKDVFSASWRNIDASGSVEEVHDVLKEDLRSVLERVDATDPHGELRLLWEGMKASQ
jgi:dTMP kinase